MKKIVISQPMFLPWIGIFQQILTADLFVHYDDVQLPDGRSFCSRVQIKSDDGVRWMSVPVKRKSKQLICDAKIDFSKNWKKSHLEILKKSYKSAPFGDLALSLVESIYKK